MSVPNSSQFPATGNDAFPVVDGTVTLQTAQHSKLHNLAHSALSNIQTYLGRNAADPLTFGAPDSDLSWDTSVSVTLKKVATALRTVRTGIGTPVGSTVGTVYGDINTVSTRVGTTSASAASTSAHGKINNINQRIGTTSDTHTAATVYGAIANSSKVSADARAVINTTLGEKLNLTGGTLTGVLTTGSQITANGAIVMNNSGLTVKSGGSNVFTVSGSTPTFIQPLVLSASAQSASHAVRKDQMDSGLALKANQPATGQAMLRFTAGQSANPVTTWLGNNANVLTSNPPVTNGQHTNGSNIQFQWVVGHNTIYAHVDAKTGVNGMDGVLGSGSQIRRMAHVPASTHKPADWPVSSEAVVASNNSISMLWYEPVIAVAVDEQQRGNIAWASGSSLRIKNLDFDTKPDFEGFFDSIHTAVFHYKDLPEVGSVMSGQHHVGFIAEEVEAAVEQFGLPRDVVTYSADGLPSGLSDRDLIAVLWNVVKKMKDTPETA